MVMTMLSVRGIISVLAIASSLSSTQALAFTATKPAATGTFSIYNGLQSTPLVRASDQQQVALTSLWRADTPFGVADEVAVCAFLRHYG